MGFAVQPFDLRGQALLGAVVEVLADGGEGDLFFEDAAADAGKFFGEAVDGAGEEGGLGAHVADGGAGGDGAEF